jgi:L-2-hydroxyglutarate oxidase LhgO
MPDRDDSRDSVDVVVIGAGVVGLAVARALALRGLQVVILESATAYGTGTSSRNSEVVHAGLYYPPGSLKATLCVQGRHRLSAYAATHQVPLQRCGKLVVATQPGDLPKLEAIRARGEACGVDDLQLLTGRQAQAMEPELQCVAALHSPSSGIVDSHALMTAYLGDAQQAGALFAVASPFTAAERDGRDWRVHTGGDEAFVLHARWLVNAAGLQAQAVARGMSGFPTAAIPTRHLAKGHYFSLARRAPFRRLIYPTPVDGGLGVHLTLDLGGQARFGPDVQWLPPRANDDGADIDYSVDPARAAGFEADIRRYWPKLPVGALQPAYSGVRPKLSGPGEPAADFHVAGPAQHGVPGVVQLFGIESPGLTASLALAEHVAELMSA